MGASLFFKLAKGVGRLGKAGRLTKGAVGLKTARAFSREELLLQAERRALVDARFVGTGKSNVDAVSSIAEARVQAASAQLGSRAVRITSETAKGIARDSRLIINNVRWRVQEIVTTPRMIPVNGVQTQVFDAVVYRTGKNGVKETLNVVLGMNAKTGKFTRYTEGANGFRPAAAGVMNKQNLRNLKFDLEGRDGRNFTRGQRVRDEAFDSVDSRFDTNPIPGTPEGLPNNPFDDINGVVSEEAFAASGRPPLPGTPGGAAAAASRATKKPFKIGAKGAIIGNVALFALPGVAGFVSKAKEDLTGESLQRRIEETIREKKANALLRTESQRVARDLASNMAQMALVAPHKVNEMLAGRRLPQGAVVFGGEQKTDLFEAAALDMTSGALSSQDPEAELRRLMGL